MAAFPTSPVKNVSFPWRLWDFPGNYQEKIGPSNAADRWADPELQVPQRTIGEREAVGLAYYLYWRGRSDEERRNFSAALARESAVKE